MDHQLKGLTRIILAFIILSYSCSCTNGHNKNHEYKYGLESRLGRLLIPMNCNEDNIVIYNEFSSYKIGEVNYDLKSFNERVGDSTFIFSIRFRTKDLEVVSNFKNPKISICLNGKLYIGRGIDRKLPTLPPECHFYFNFGMLGKLNINDDGLLYCKSIRYLPQKEFRKQLTPSEE